MKSKLLLTSVLLILLAVLAVMILKKANTAGTGYRLPPASQTKKDYGGHGKPNILLLMNRLEMGEEYDVPY